MIVRGNEIEECSFHVFSRELRIASEDCADDKNRDSHRHSFNILLFFMIACMDLIDIDINAVN